MKFLIKGYSKLIDIFLTFLGIVSYNFFNKNFLFFSKRRVKKHQYKKLKKLLIECQKNVPYYKQLFAEINFNPHSDFLSLEDLQKIPILEKDTLIARREDFINVRKNYFYIKTKTSGTSGEPFISYVSYKHWIVEQAVIWRQWKSFGYKFRDKIAIIRSFSPKSGEPLIKNDSIRNFIYYSPYHLSDENMHDYYEDMISRKIKFLRGYPSSLKIFASFCKKYDLSIPNLKGIFLASESLSNDDKSYIKNAFNVPIINHYGLAECVVMFGSLFKDKYLYNYDDYGFLETIEKSNDEFEVVGTNLNNNIMPLIRFNTRDKIKLKIGKDSNESRINFKIIKNISGRGNDVIKTTNKDIPLTNIYTMMGKISEIIQWQIIQKKDLDLIINIKCDIKSELEIKKILNSKLLILKNEDLDIKINMNSGFIRTGEGKIPVFLRKK